MLEKFDLQARRRFPLQCNGPNGARVGKRDEAAARPLLDGHLRNDRNSEARANHAENAAELTALENYLRI